MFGLRFTVASSNMSEAKACANCEAQGRETHCERGTACLTCYFFADLQVATHNICAHQPEMLTVLDTALADARTLAHRIINQDKQGDTAAGATKLNHQWGAPF